MTPKEKAKELFTKFSGNTIHYDSAKQCALIAVDEIEKAERNVLLKFNLVNEDMIMHYWQLVKQEIENL